ncbi:MAG TPA: hypothetical protein PLZ84_09265, partial [Clostridia bacterium]|nr:hypothetical protein [Clostridia bacterium]
MTDDITLTKPEAITDYDAAVEQMKQKYNSVLSSSPPVIRSFIGHFASAHGKFIRARALLACAQNNLGHIVPDAVSLAAAIEVFHLATLV